jgi:hypothetical protein
LTAFLTKLRGSVAYRLDQRQPGDERSRRPLLEVDRAPGHHGEGRAADEFAVVGGEFRDQSHRESGIANRSAAWSTISQELNSSAMARAWSADTFLRLLRKQRQQARLADAGFAQSASARVVITPSFLASGRSDVLGTPKPFDVRCRSGPCPPTLRSSRAIFSQAIGQRGRPVAARAQPMPSIFCSRASSEEVSQRLPPMACTSLRRTGRQARSPAAWRRCCLLPTGRCRDPCASSRRQSRVVFAVDSWSCGGFPSARSRPRPWR